MSIRRVAAFHARWLLLPLTAIASVLTIFATSASARTVRMPSVPVVIAATMNASIRTKTEPSLLTGALLAYPPLRSVQKPATIVCLHGIRGRTANGCPVFRAAVSAFGWLVCPEPSVPDAPGFANEAGADSNAANVLVGFSQGSYVALDLLARHPGTYRGVILLAADLTPTKKRLGGVIRVVLGAGMLDGSFAPLKRAAASLRSEGVEVRFVSLGNVGHTYRAEDSAVLDDAIAWVSGTDA